METQIATAQKLIDAGIAFGVAYGFQLLGAAIIVAIGFKLAGVLARGVTGLAERRGIDVTLARFFGGAVRLVVIVMVTVAALANLGITIVPMIAAIGAAAFGATVAIQGPLANFGAGLSIILTRPFVVGNTITVKGVSGVVEEIALGATILRGDDGERITVPNRQIVGEIIWNSHQHRIVEETVRIGGGVDPQAACAALTQALAAIPEIAANPAPQVGIHRFAVDGVVLGLRFWIPSRGYHPTRFAANRAVQQALAALERRGGPVPLAAA